jgi:hypothetical protein
MPRGDTNPRGMPPSRNTVFVDRTVSEAEFEENWRRAFGQTEGTHETVIPKQGTTRHRLKSVDDNGEWKSSKDKYVGGWSP